MKGKYYRLDALQNLQLLKGRLDFKDTIAVKNESKSYVKITSMSSTMATICHRAKKQKEVSITSLLASRKQLKTLQIFINSHLKTESLKCYPIGTMGYYLMKNRLYRVEITDVDIQTIKVSFKTYLIDPIWIPKNDFIRNRGDFDKKRKLSSKGAFVDAEIEQDYESYEQDKPFHEIYFCNHCCCRIGDFRLSYSFELTLDAIIAKVQNITTHTICVPTAFKQNFLFMSIPERVLAFTKWHRLLT